MNATLVRKYYRSDGIFGELYDAMGDFICVTLEHAYQDGSGWGPKVAIGVYDCVLADPTEKIPYQAYELQNVPDFQGQPVTGIKIHILNTNAESEGCIGLGEKISQWDAVDAITNSRAAFEKFMALQKGYTQFRLTIISRPEDLTVEVA